MQLHEQFRPTTWSEVIGQDKVLAKIGRLRKRGLAGRTYWLSGQSGTGKTTIARLIAAEVADDWEIDGSKCTPAKVDEIEESLSSSYCRSLFARLAKKTGIDKRVHPHGLRHTGASEMREEGIDIGVISKQLGHASISTTARYLDHLAPTAVVQAIRGRRWVPEPSRRDGDDL